MKKPAEAGSRRHNVAQHGRFLRHHSTQPRQPPHSFGRAHPQAGTPLPATAGVADDVAQAWNEASAKSFFRGI